MSLQALLDKLDSIEKKMDEKTNALAADLAAMQNQIDTKGGGSPALTKSVEDLAKGQMALQAEYAAAKKAIQAVEKRAGVRTGKGDVEIERASPLAFGRMFGRSDEYKHFMKNRSLGQKNSKDVEFKRSFFSYRELERKATTFADIDGTLRTPFFRPDIVEPNKRIPVHRMFANVLPMPGDGDTVTIRRELQEHIWVGCAAAAQTGGNNTLVLEKIAGLLDNSVGDDVLAKIIVHNTLGPENHVVDDITVATKTITLAANLANDVAIGDLITAFVFDFTEEGTFKAQSLDEWEDFDAKALTLATWIQVTNQALEDASMLEDTIERKLLSKLARTEEKLFFYGPGGSQSWLGLMRDTSIPIVLWSAQPLGTTKLDLLFFVMVVIALSENTANVCFVNWQDYRDVLLTKGTDGHYLFWQVMTAGRPAQIWAMQIVPTTVMEPGDAFCGDLEMGVTLYDKEEALIRIGEPEDFFFKNAKAMLAEERVAMAVELPLAMARVKFDSAPVP